MSDLFGEIVASEQIVDFDVHPLENFVAILTVAGVVEIHAFIDAKSTNFSKKTACFVPDVDGASIRCINVDGSGKRLLLATSAGSVAAYSFDTQAFLGRTAPTGVPISALATLPAPHEAVVAAGDENGVVALWDFGDLERPLYSHSRHSDCVTSIRVTNYAPSQFLPDSTSASMDDDEDGATRPGQCVLAQSVGCDGRLDTFCYDMDDQKCVFSAKRGVPDEELTCVCRVKKDSATVACSTRGVMYVFPHDSESTIFLPHLGEDEYEMRSFVGHPESIDCMLRVDDDTVLTGSSDGLIRVVQLGPDSLLGLAGDHDGFPVEVLKYAGKNRYVVSASHDAVLRFWDLSYLWESDSDTEGSDAEETKKQAPDGDFFDDL